jgi:probable rRNA maturation factor
MIEITNEAGLECDVAILEKIATSFTKKPIELLITDNETIQNINKEYRNIDKPTDVLSFPFTPSKHSPLGSIVISSEYVKNVAQKLGHTPTQELTLLFIHGLLHLLGYDHEVDNGEMRLEEEKIIKKYNLPNSLIVRTHT